MAPDTIATARLDDEAVLDQADDNVAEALPAIPVLNEAEAAELERLLLLLLADEHTVVSGKILVEQGHFPVDLYGKLMVERQHSETREVLLDPSSRTVAPSDIPCDTRVFEWSYQSNLFDELVEAVLNNQISLIAADAKIMAPHIDALAKHGTPIPEGLIDHEATRELIEARTRKLIADFLVIIRPMKAFLEISSIEERLRWQLIGQGSIEGSDLGDSDGRLGTVVERTRAHIEAIRAAVSDLPGLQNALIIDLLDHLRATGFEDVEIIEISQQQHLRIRIRVPDRSQTNDLSQLVSSWITPENGDEGPTPDEEDPSSHEAPPALDISLAINVCSWVNDGKGFRADIVIDLDIYRVLALAGVGA